MKHILNDLSEQEKNSIREQHTGGMKVMTENFNKLLNSKLGDVKPLNEQTRTPIQNKSAQTNVANQSRTVKVDRGVADFTNIPNDKIQGMVNSYAVLYNKTVKGEASGAINDYGIFQRFPDEFNPYKFLKNPNDSNLGNVFLAIQNFCNGTDNSLATKFKTVKPKLENPFAFFTKPVELGALIDWWNNPVNNLIIEMFIGTYIFVPENGNIFRNQRTKQVKTIVPQDFLTAFNEIQAESFDIYAHGPSKNSAVFVNGGKGYKYVKTANGYVLSEYGQE